MPNFTLASIEHAHGQRWVATHEGDNTYLYKFDQISRFVRSIDALKASSHLIGINKTADGFEFLFKDADTSAAPNHGYMNGQTIHKTAVSIKTDEPAEVFFKRFANADTYIKAWEQQTSTSNPTPIEAANKGPVSSNTEIAGLDAATQGTTEEITVDKNEIANSTPSDLNMAVYETADGDFRGAFGNEVIILGRRVAMENGKTREENFDSFVEFTNNNKHLPIEDRLKAAQKELEKQGVEDAVLRIDYADVYEMTSPNLNALGIDAFSPLTRFSGFRVKAKNNTDTNETVQIEPIDGEVDLKDRALLGYFANHGRLPIGDQADNPHLISGKWIKTDKGHTLSFSLSAAGIDAAFPNLPATERTAIKRELAGKTIQLPSLAYGPEKYQKWLNRIEGKAEADDVQIGQYQTEFKTETIAFNSHNRFFATTMLPTYGFNITEASKFLTEEKGVELKDYTDWLISDVILGDASRIPAGISDRRAKKKAKALLSDPWLANIIGNDYRADMRKVGTRHQYYLTDANIPAETKANTKTLLATYQSEVANKQAHVSDLLSDLNATKRLAEPETRAAIQHIGDYLALQQDIVDLEQTLLKGDKAENAKQGQTFFDRAQDRRLLMMARVDDNLDQQAKNLANDNSVPESIRALIKENSFLFEHPANLRKSPSRYMAHHNFIPPNLPPPVGYKSVVSLEVKQFELPVPTPDISTAPNELQPTRNVTARIDGQAHVRKDNFSVLADVDTDVGVRIDPNVPNGQSQARIIEPFTPNPDDILDQDHVRLSAVGRLSQLDQIKLETDYTTSHFNTRRSQRLSYEHASLNGKVFDIGLNIGDQLKTPSSVTFMPYGVSAGIENTKFLSGKNIEYNFDLGLSKAEWQSIDGQSQVTAPMFNIRTGATFNGQDGNSIGGRAAYSSMLSNDENTPNQFSISLDGKYQLNDQLKLTLNPSFMKANDFQQRGIDGGMELYNNGKTHALNMGFRHLILDAPMYGFDAQMLNFGYDLILNNDLRLGLNIQKPLNKSLDIPTTVGISAKYNISSQDKHKSK